MNSFRLLPRRKLIVVTRQESRAKNLTREGYDVIWSTPRSKFSWILFCSRHLRRLQSYHWLIESPLVAKDEGSLQVILRLFPFLIASWTRLEQSDPTDRLIWIAERDYKLDAQKRNHRHEPTQNQSRSSVHAAKEFDRLLEESPS